MLEFAIHHKEEVEKLYRLAVTRPNSLFYSMGVYMNFDPQIKPSTWEELQFVSLHKGKVIGYLACDVNRGAHAANHLRMIFLSEGNLHSALFGIDCRKFFRKLFFEYNFNKVNWSVIIGNPAEKKYDAICSHLNGCVVGTKKKETRLTDGKLYDLKMYELHRVDLPTRYFKVSENKRVK